MNNHTTMNIHTIQSTYPSTSQCANTATNRSSIQETNRSTKASNQESVAQKKPFRVSAKKILLTYSQVEKQLEAQNDNHAFRDCDLQKQIQQIQQIQPQQIREQLLEKNPNVKGYVVSKQRHKDGGTHFHVILEASNKFDIKNPHKLDLEFSGKKIHGNYKKINNYKKVVEYICKDAEYDSNNKSIENGKFISLSEKLFATLSDKGVDGTMKYYLENHLEKAISSKSFVGVKRSLQEIQETQSDIQQEQQEAQDQELQQLLQHVTLSDFNLPSTVKQWMESGFRRTGIMFGPAACGKTVFALILAHVHNWKILTVSHPDDLTSLKNIHDMILFDDTDFHSMNDQQLLQLFENQRKNRIGVRYTTVSRGEKKRVQLILLNYDAYKRLHKKAGLDRRQVSRRIHVMHVPHNFLNTNNVFIQQNTNIYNNQLIINQNNWFTRNIDNLEQESRILEYQTQHIQAQALQTLNSNSNVYLPDCQSEHLPHLQKKEMQS